MSTALDSGYFPRRSSALRRVQEERAVGLLYGQRALMIGALNPLNYVGTAENSRGRQEPFKRLAHTGEWFETIFFGSRGEADAVLAAVHRMHERVRGVLPDDAGPFPAGTPYSALDPELMLWTIAVMADSAECFYELLVRPLSPTERESLWADYVRFGELFGMPREVAPPTHREFRSWWAQRLESDEMFLTEEARHVGHAVAFRIPVPLTHAPAMRVHNLIMLGSLPQRVREIYGLSWSAPQEAAYRLVTRAVRTARPLAPRRLARGFNTSFFELVVRTERDRIAQGLPTPALPD
jgi:uncharacterized protein (DUF2236 family)